MSEENERKPKVGCGVWTALEIFISKGSDVVNMLDKSKNLLNRSVSKKKEKLKLRLDHCILLQKKVENISQSNLLCIKQSIIGEWFHEKDIESNTNTKKSKIDIFNKYIGTRNNKSSLRYTQSKHDPIKTFEKSEIQ